MTESAASTATVGSGGSGDGGDAEDALPTHVVVSKDEYEELLRGYREQHQQARLERLQQHRQRDAAAAANEDDDDDGRNGDGKRRRRRAAAEREAAGNEARATREREENRALREDLDPEPQPPRVGSAASPSTSGDDADADDDDDRAGPTATRAENDDGGVADAARVARTFVPARKRGQAAQLVQRLRAGSIPGTRLAGGTVWYRNQEVGELPAVLAHLYGRLAPAKLGQRQAGRARALAAAALPEMERKGRRRKGATEQAAEKQKKKKKKKPARPKGGERRGGGGQTLPQGPAGILHSPQLRRLLRTGV